MQADVTEMGLTTDMALATTDPVAMHKRNSTNTGLLVPISAEAESQPSFGARGSVLRAELTAEGLDLGGIDHDLFGQTSA